MSSSLALRRNHPVTSRGDIPLLSDYAREHVHDFRSALQCVTLKRTYCESDECL